MSESLRFDVTLTKTDMIRGRLLAYFRSGWGVAGRRSLRSKQRFYENQGTDART